MGPGLSWRARWRRTHSRHRCSDLRAGTRNACARSLHGGVSVKGSVDDIDRRILAFIGAHWFVLAAHVQAFLGVEEEENADRLRGLEAGGLVRSERLLRGRASSVRITGAGLEAIGSLLPAPGFDLGGYRHEVAVVWLWVAAWRGAFGEAERVLSRREMQGVDRAARDAGGEASGFAVSLPARGGSGSPGLCYPDVG